MKSRIANAAFLALIAASMSSCNSKHSSSSPAPQTQKQVEAQNTSTPSSEEATRPVEEKTESNHVTDITVSRYVELNEDMSNINEFKIYLNTVRFKAIYVGEAENEITLKCIPENQSMTVYTGEFETDDSLQEKTARITLSSDKTRNPNFDCSIMDGNKVVFKKSIKVKRDVYLYGDYSTKEKTLSDSDLPASGQISLGALIIEDASLITQGADIDLRVDDFFAIGSARLETFSEKDLSSKPGTEGKSGGRIAISAKRAFGELEVFMRGKNGGKYGSVENSYENFKIPQQDCQFKNDTRTYYFPTKGVQGLKGGNSGILNIAVGDNQMEVRVHKLPGKGGAGQISTNPVSEISVNFKLANTVIAKYPWAIPEIGKTLDERYTQHNPTYLYLGQVCNQRHVGYYQNHYARYDYVVTDIADKKAQKPLTSIDSTYLQTGPDGLSGVEEPASLYDETKQRTQNL